MPSLGLLMLILQVSCAVHVIKRGNERGWLWIILLFPGVGSLIYLVIEIIPDIQHGQTFVKASQGVNRMLSPKAKLRHCAESLQIADTVANRVNLAEELLAQGMPREAIEIYEKAMQGPFKDYPPLLSGLASAYFEAAAYEEAKTALDRLLQNHPPDKRHKERLLYARTLEALGDFAAASQAYETLCTSYPGPEAKCRYALMLKRRGEMEQAVALLQDIVTTARRSTRYYNKLHKTWLSRAKRELSDRAALRN